VKRWTTRAAELLGDPEVDAVVLALPACARTALALEAFRRGKHVLTEKPVAMNAAEVERSISAQGSRVAACCSSRYRFTEAARAAEAFFRTGALGALRSLYCRNVVGIGPRPTKPPPTWRLMKAQNGGGILMNWGCYDLDYMLGITGWSVAPRAALGKAWRVAPHLAEMRAAPGSDAETHVTALVLCDGGVVLDYERAEMYAGATQTGWQMTGEKGTLRLQMTCVEQGEIVFEKADPAAGLCREIIWKGKMDSSVVHSGPLADFVAAILTGRGPCTSLKEALVVQRITDAIYRSAESGRLEPV
jgi:predicted dehydrogenase